MATPFAVHAASMDALARKLARGAISLENKKVAVLSFPYHDEKVSSASTLLSERLTTSLVMRKEVRVLERHLMQELLKERKLGESGIIDPLSFRDVGKLLDSDAVVTGTLIDLPDNKTELNARLIRTDTGEMLSAGRIVVTRTWSDSPVASKPISSGKPPSKISSETRSTVDPNEATDGLIGPVGNVTIKRLSNESFPPGRRKYISDVPEHDPALLMELSREASSRGSSSDSYSNEVNFLPDRGLPVRSDRNGYYGTDAPMLPPPRLSAPLGTVQAERRAAPRPPTSRSRSSQTHK